MSTSFSYIRDTERCEEALSNITNLRNKHSVGLDTEGTGLFNFKSKIRLVQLSVGNRCYMFDVFKLDIKQVCGPVIEAAKAGHIQIYAHNFKYDLQMFWCHRVDFADVTVFDTMLMAQICTGGSWDSYSLKNCLANVFGHSMDKTEQKSDWGRKVLSQAQLVYAADDPIYTAKLGEHFLQLIQKENLTATFKLETRLLPAIASMEYYGVSLDQARLAEMRPIFEQKIQDAEDTFLAYVPNRKIRRNLNGEIIDKGFNLSSSDQVLAMFRHHNVPNPVFDETEDPLVTSTASTVLKQLDYVAFPFVVPLLAYRGLIKILTGYIYALPARVNEVTGRIHTSYRQMVSTGRLSSSAPNLQNLARPVKGEDISVRSCFVPRSPDHIFVGADYSQIELRIIAQLLYTDYGDNVMRQEFLDKRDPYISTAALLDNVPYDTMVTIDEQGNHHVKPEAKGKRQSAKAVKLGYNYCMGADKFRLYAKFSYGVDMTPAESKKNRETYLNGYPGLLQYHAKCYDKRLRKAYTLNPFHRVRKWLKYPGPSALANHPIQGTGGDMLKLAVVRIYEELYKQGYHVMGSWDIMLLLNIHDELIAECLKDKAEDVKQLIQTHMVKAGNLLLKDVPVDADPILMNHLADK